MPALKEAVEHIEESTRRLRSFHFKGILAAMLVIRFVVAGGLLLTAGGSLPVTTRLG